MAKPKRRICKATGCDHVIGRCGCLDEGETRSGNAIYCHEACSKKMRNLRHRAVERERSVRRRKERIDALLSEDSDEARRTIERLARQRHQGDLRNLPPRPVRVRRGPLFHDFVEKGWPQLINDKKVTQGEAAAYLETSEANISGWMAAWQEDEQNRLAAAEWEMSEDAERALVDFEFFRSRYFRDEWGKPYVTTDFHRRWIVATLRAMKIGGRLVILSPPRHGKALDDETPIFTSGGWARMGSLVPGDEVLGADGRFTKVEGVYPQGAKEAFEVRFSDGASVVACGEHLWEVEQRYGGPARVLTTDDLRRDLFEADGRKKWRIPVMEPMEGVERILPLDPYLLGCWLGDGTATRGEITTADEQIVEDFAAGGYPHSYVYEGSSGRAKTYGLPGLVSVLRALGVLGDKHVPVDYLTASVSQRTALLAGLCDADGTVAKNGSQQSYCTTEPRLADAVRFLVNSLGGTWTERVRMTNEASRESWEIWFRLPPPLGAFRLPRKRDRLAPPSARNRPRRFVESIRPVGPRPMTCITVAHERHLYAAGRELVLTHNTDLLTHFCVWLIIRDPNIRILWVGLNESIAGQSIELIRDHLEHNEVLIRDFLPSGQHFRPEQGSGRSWTARKLVVATRTITLRSPTIAAVGRAGKMLSRDADLVVMDDIIDHEAVQQPASRESDLRWVNSQVGSRKESHTAVMAIGSRQHHHDLWGRIVKNPIWAAIVEHAHDPNCPLPRHEDGIPEGHDEWGETSCEICTAHTGCMLWKGKRSFAWLEEQRFAMDDDEQFEMVYQNKTRPAAALHLEEDDIRRCYNHERRLGEYPPACRLIGGIDPAADGDQVGFVWGYHVVEDRRYMVDFDIQRGGGLPHVRKVIQLYYELYKVQLWVVERNGYQSAIMQDRDVIEYVSANGISLRPSFTDKWNKFDENFGVTKQFSMFKQTGVVLDRRTGEPTEERRPKIDLPWGDTAARGKVGMYRDQLLDFEGATRHTRKDIVMAAWLPETIIRVWRRDQQQEVQELERRTEYPLELLGDIYHQPEFASTGAPHGRPSPA